MQTSDKAPQASDFIVSSRIDRGSRNDDTWMQGIGSTRFDTTARSGARRSASDSISFSKNESKQRKSTRCVS